MDLQDEKQKCKPKRQKGMSLKIATFYKVMGGQFNA